MSNDIVQVGFTAQLDHLKIVEDQHREVWSARDLMPYAGYTDWRNWSKAIDRAIASVNASGLNAADHFVGVNKMVALGSGAQRGIEDVDISRHGCYVLFQNADGSKPEVAAAQQYFAVQTRRQEIADSQPTIDLSRMQILELAMDSERRALAETERADTAEKAVAAFEANPEYPFREFRRLYFSDEPETRMWNALHSARLVINNPRGRGRHPRTGQWVPSKDHHHPYAGLGSHFFTLARSLDKTGVAHLGLAVRVNRAMELVEWFEKRGFKSNRGTNELFELTNTNTKGIN
ncbi:hypothetical protein GCM10022198_00490 [Klugiella xanthotipulae]|uniref:Bro-N domain-containing protein n=1 Tax=Klugiella xanthotipulae TaxID=244735 RepID=A0A543I5E4_9MICO|nr:BRO family protein [Klugiella xanthotipulae]TQM65812.1 hypothetical protein FB466_0625 [Klugiella xanthotipulae]